MNVEFGNIIHDVRKRLRISVHVFFDNYMLRRLFITKSTDIYKKLQVDTFTFSFDSCISLMLIWIYLYPKFFTIQFITYYLTITQELKWHSRNRIKFIRKQLTIDLRLWLFVTRDYSSCIVLLLRSFLRNIVVKGQKILHGAKGKLRVSEGNFAVLCNGTDEMFTPLTLTLQVTIMTPDCPDHEVRSDDWGSSISM